MALSKLDLAVVVAVAGGMLWIEHTHRVSIATPRAAAFEAPDASVCPESDSVPFSADCLAFIRGGGAPLHASAKARIALTDARRHGDPTAPACPPNNENEPYTAACLKYLSGWFWQATPTGAAP